MPSANDRCFMAAALALATRGQGQTGTNPSVGCLIVKHGRVIGRGWTQPGGRPHAEAMALAQAGEAANGATVYVTLEPCAHKSARGPACADLLVESKAARIVVALSDVDPRTRGKGVARLMAAGIEVTTDETLAMQATAALAGYISRMQRNRPLVTLKLATSLDGAIAMQDGSSRWITAEAARAHAHLERTRQDAILVGGGTLRSDAPRLDVRLPGLQQRSPQRYLLSRSESPAGWTVLERPEGIIGLTHNYLLVEGGAGAASAFLKAGLVDRLLLYRAPILIGAGKPCLGDIGLEQLADAHGQWQLTDARQLGPDRMELYVKSEAA